MNIDPTNIVIDKYQEDDKKRKRVKKLILHIYDRKSTDHI